MSAVPAEHDCAVLVSSCDAYSDLWRPFFTLFFRHWPDCPFPVYLSANRQAYDDPRVTTLRYEAGTAWGSQIRAHLGELGTTYVLLVLEDFFWRRPTPTDEVLARLADLRATCGDMLRLVDRPPPDRPVAGHPAIGEIDAHASFRVSTQATLWRREALLALLREGESIWAFEVEGSARSAAQGRGYYATWRQVLPYDYHVVERGKWFRHEARRFGRMDVGCDFSRRAVMSRREAAAARLEWLKSRVLHLLPAGTRRQMVALARRVGI
jgi:hypothetical protein